MLEQEQVKALEARARRGEAAAFGQLIRDFDHDLRGVVWAVVRSSDATDDVMQVAYEKAFRAIGTFDGRSALKTWLHSICYRAAIDYVRYEARRRHFDVDSVAESGTFAELIANAGDTASVDDRMAVDRLLDELDPEARALLMLTVGMGFSFDETAELVGMKRGTVASKVSRARSRLAARGQS